MMRTREGMWVFAFMCLTTAIVRLLLLRATLWPQLGIGDWFMLAVLLVLPILALWRHLRHVREMTDAVSTTGFQLVIGGYLPLWFGFTLVERVLKG
jgi:cbb3-type cytochrome oxidase subunit 1